MPMICNLQEEFSQMQNHFRSFTAFPPGAPIILIKIIIVINRNELRTFHFEFEIVYEGHDDSAVSLDCQILFI